MKSKIIAIDVETTGLNPWRDQLLGVSIAMPDGDSAYYKWYGKDVLSPFPYEMLADAETVKVGHNIRFDIKFLLRNGIEVNGNFEDTKLLAQLIDENQSLSLKPLSKRYLPGDPLRYKRYLDAHLKELKLDMGKLSDTRVDQTLVADYCNEDTRNTLALYQLFIKMVRPEALRYYHEEMLPLERVLLDMELRGNRVDTDKLDEACGELNTRVLVHREKLELLLKAEMETVRDEVWHKLQEKKKTQAGRDKTVREEFNWNSGPQKIRLFYGLLGLGQYCTEITEKGTPTLQQGALDRVVGKIPDGKLKEALTLQSDYGVYSKMLSTYVVGLQERLESGRIHAEYHQVSREDFQRQDDTGGTVTGRLSHRNPNLGNLPRSDNENAAGYDYWRGTFVKDLFIPEPEHVFIYADYSQIELRVAAHLSQDQALLKAFQDNLDPHQQTADFLGLPGKQGRQMAKTINFLLIYFGSPWRLCMQLGWSPDNDLQIREAERIRDMFFEGYPELLAWIHSQRRALRERGELTSLFGRTRHLPDVWGVTKKDVGHALKQGSNFIVQSVAASVAKRAMIKLHQAGFVIVNQVHDSITCQCKVSEAEERLSEMMRIMESAVTLSVPLTVDGKIIKTFRE